MIFGDIGDILSKFKKIQEDLKRVQEELKEETYRAVAEGVTCVVSGDMEVKEINIDSKLLNSGNAKKVERLVKEAVSNAIGEAKAEAKVKLKRLTGDLPIPGLF